MSHIQNWIFDKEQFIWMQIKSLVKLKVCKNLKLISNDINIILGFHLSMLLSNVRINIINISMSILMRKLIKLYMNNEKQERENRI